MSLQCINEKRRRLISTPHTETGPHTARTLPVDVGVLQVERLTGVVAQDKREHGVLHEVVEGAASVLVEMREVLKVGDLARAPQLGERRDVAVLQQVGQVRGQDVVVDVVAELVRRKGGRGRERRRVFYSFCFFFFFPVQELKRKGKGRGASLLSFLDFSFEAAV